MSVEKQAAVHRPVTQQGVPIEGWRVHVGLAAAMAAGFSSTKVLPLLLGSFVDGFAISESDAGGLIALEFAALAVADLGLAARIHVLDPRRVCLLGLLLLFAGNALTMAGGGALLVSARVVAGLGEGAVAAAFTAVAAGTRVPERTFAWLTVVGSLFGIALIEVLPFVVAWLGPRAPFGVIAGLPLLLGPLVLGLPRHGPSPGKASPRRVWVGAAVLAVFASLLLFAVGQAGLFIYQERIGQEIGTSLSNISHVLALGELGGLLAGGIAVAIGTRAGSTLPISAALLLSAVSGLLLAYSVSFWPYLGGAFLFAVAFYFAVPYYQGLLAFLDQSGRAAASSAGVLTVGGAVGPALAAALVTGADYGLIGWMAAASFVGSWVCAIRVMRLSDHQRKPRPTSRPGVPEGTGYDRDRRI